MAPTRVAEPAGPGDGAPNHADNNAWKQRGELTPAEKRTGERMAARIRPKLAPLRKAGDFSLASTRQALLDLGFAPDGVQVQEMWPMAGTDTIPPGAVFAVRFPRAGCVTGAVRPDRLMVEVAAAAAEFGCLEPFTH